MNNFYLCLKCNTRLDILCKVQGKEHMLCKCVNTHGDEAAAKQKLDQLDQRDGYLKK